VNSATVTLAIAWARYVAAHTAAFGALAKAVVDFASGDRAAALGDLLTALAGFGLAIKPTPGK
jgi:hypothetical protein